MINWKVRFKNKSFWIAFIPAVIILVQVILKAFGVAFDADQIAGKAIAIVDAVFAVLALLGIAIDPTTEGISDSEQALTYEEPKRD